MFNGNSGTVSGIVNNNTFGTAERRRRQPRRPIASPMDGHAFFGGIDSKVAAAPATINYALASSIDGNTIRDVGRRGR